MKMLIGFVGGVFLVVVVSVLGSMPSAGYRVVQDHRYTTNVALYDLGDPIAVECTATEQKGWGSKDTPVSFYAETSVTGFAGYSAHGEASFNKDRSWISWSTGRVVSRSGAGESPEVARNMIKGCVDAIPR